MFKVGKVNILYERIYSVKHCSVVQEYDKLKFY